MKDAERIAELEAALRDVLGTAVILSRDYLAVFDDWAPTMTIQGWGKQDWIKAIEAKERAISIAPSSRASGA